MTKKPEQSMEAAIYADGRYPQEAFAFLHDGLGHAVEFVHGAEALREAAAKGDPDPQQLHVTGQQLCHGLRDLAIDRWGPLARTVLSQWNIRGTIDFGNMVYLLIDNEFMRKTDEDSVEDFRDVYDFETAFATDDNFELTE